MVNGVAAQARVGAVRDLFRDASQTEFVIATVPTVLGVNEAGRLAGALREDGVPCRRVVVNQVVADGAGDAWVAMRLRDQAAALRGVAGDAQLAALRQLRGPLLDLEVRGPAALQYFGDLLWAPAFDDMAASARPAPFRPSPHSKSP